MDAKLVILLCYLSYACSTVPDEVLNFEPGDTFQNCLSTIPPGEIVCDAANPFRTISGVCNNLTPNREGEGAIRSPLLRFQNAVYTEPDSTTTPRGFLGIDPNIPPANFVSRELFDVEVNSNRSTNDLTVLYMTFGQFLDHDLVLSPHASCTVSDCSDINVAYAYPCIPIRNEVSSSKCNPFARAIPVCPPLNPPKDFARDQLNIITSFVDASNVYGSEDDFADRLRERKTVIFKGKKLLKLFAKLRVATRQRVNTNLLPRDNLISNCETRGGCSLVGDERGDENTALHTMHTLWVREHNRIVDVFYEERKKTKRDWSEEQIYQTARKIVGGMMQRIVYEEWLPKIAKLSEYTGRYDSSVNPSVSNVFATAAFRFGHSLIPNRFLRLKNDFTRDQGPLTVQNSFLNRRSVNRRGIEPIMFGLVGSRANDVDNGFSFDISRKLFVPPREPGIVDLTAYNIARGRDHGLPTYLEWRKFCGLPTVDTFKELDGILKPGIASAFESVYNGNIQNIDLFPAGISEPPVDGLEIGPTFSCIIAKQFENLRDGDRFFYLNRGVFTRAQQRELGKVTMSGVMCNNLVHSSSDDLQIKTIQRDAFKPASNSERVPCSQIPQADLSAWFTFLDNLKN